MKNIEIWQDEKEYYTLNNGFSLEKAEKFEFIVYYKVYSGIGDKLYYSWRIQLKKIDYLKNYYWILKNEDRIGGVIIQPNYFSHFFLQPQFYNDKLMIISELNNVLEDWSNRDKIIDVLGILPDDVDLFHKLGYEIKSAQRTMIRPTEIFDNIELSDKFIFKSPTLKDSNEIGRLFSDAYKNSIENKLHGELSLEEWEKSTEMFLKQYMFTKTLIGSTLVYTKDNNELIGVCMAGKDLAEENKDFSSVFNIAVKKSYRNNNIATFMIKRALTNLKESTDQLKLDVQIGNNSEHLYKKLGFFPEVKLSKMYKE